MPRCEGLGGVPCCFSTTSPGDEAIATQKDTKTCLFCDPHRLDELQKNRNGRATISRSVRKFAEHNRDVFEKALGRMPPERRMAILKPMDKGNREFFMKAIGQWHLEGRAKTMKILADG